MPPLQRRELTASKPKSCKHIHAKQLTTSVAYIRQHDDVAHTPTLGLTGTQTHRRPINGTNLCLHKWPGLQYHCRKTHEQTCTSTSSSTLYYETRILVYLPTCSSDLWLILRQCFLCSSCVCDLREAWDVKCSGNHRDVQLEHHTLTFKIIHTDDEP